LGRAAAGHRAVAIEIVAVDVGVAVVVDAIHAGGVGVLAVATGAAVDRTRRSAVAVEVVAVDVLVAVVVDAVHARGIGVLAIATGAVAGRGDRTRAGVGEIGRHRVRAATVGAAAGVVAVGGLRGATALVGGRRGPARADDESEREVTMEAM